MSQDRSIPADRRKRNALLTAAVALFCAALSLSGGHRPAIAAAVQQADPPACPSSPPAPPDLTASPAARAVELRWQAAPCAVRYEITTWSADQPDWQRIDDGNLTDASFSHTGLTPGTTYFYAIRTVNAAGLKSPWLQNFVSAAVPDADPERAALTALYQATNGAGWTHNNNWLSSAPLAAWYGVVTDHNGRVIELNLPANGLTGPLPDLSALTGLTRLTLQTNWLRGPIPDLSALSNLTWLDLGHNRLRGPIPDLSALTGLTKLAIGVNGLTGSIPDLSTLSNLSDLDLESNRLTGPIPDLSALSNLSRLDLASNRLTGPIPDLSALSNLTELDLRYNQLSGPVPDLSALVDIIDLSLAGNQLCLPQNIDLSRLNETAAAHLQSLDPPACTGAQTPRSTQSPAASEEKAALIALYHAVGGPRWTHSDNWLSAAPLAAWHGVRTDSSGRVTGLVLVANRLLGPIPDLSALSNLTELNLGHNQLLGPIPDLSALTNLNGLDLGHNQLRGPIPDLSTLTNLTSLDLASNQLRGPIPDLSTLTNLTSLDLGHNQLRGPLPDLRVLTNLTDLDLASNQLTGPLPDLRVL
ncbi:MAG: fibronectin type III domain-containing protein, partial [Caldilineaceae bacterium]|nr:fibronectin type III domain-containing protein [Caldilineaceae bacterium]